MNFRPSKACSKAVACLLLSIVSLVASSSMVAPGSSTKPTLKQLKGKASQDLLRRLDTRQLPGGVQLDPDEQQTFLLQAPKAPDLGIAMIFLVFDTHKLQDGEPAQCGVFFTQPDGLSRYVPVIGSPHINVEQLCGGVVALGLADDPGPHPALIFIFNQTMPHNDAAEPFVFTWNSATSIYDRDDKLTQWLWKQPQYPSTVAQVRRLVKRYPAVKR